MVVTSIAKWAVALLVLMIVFVPAGAAAIAGAVSEDLLVAFGAWLVSTGICCGVAARWVGEE